MWLQTPSSYHHHIDPTSLTLAHPRAFTMHGAPPLSWGMWAQLLKLLAHSNTCSRPPLRRGIWQTADGEDNEPQNEQRANYGTNGRTNGGTNDRTNDETNDETNDRRWTTKTGKTTRSRTGEMTRRKSEKSRNLASAWWKRTTTFFVVRFRLFLSLLPPRSLTPNPRLT